MKPDTSLRNRLLTDMKSAMKAKDMSALGALKLAYAECRNREIELKTELNDAQMTSVLKKQIKQYEESLEQYEKAGRTEQAQEQKTRLNFIKSYLPKALSEEELKAIITTAVEELKPAGLKDMGRVIKSAQVRAKGMADGRRLAQLVKERLQGI